ncbi:penicillin-binding transpeptidase domain-containing protein [Desulfotomaculum copahuensis]|uniref:Stage V sporulation protein D n=1 Tax=Desulfotomaculum copahuensis TaxID=1838280 RepID=A0A1B7LJG3_9FIRM|nr:penicillin-binding transpeptidase domain-containing protein [Desulfotomaculum copahuensis]OAT86708.1 stage V sporulation protein D [Desulfotomaculum copahuensis]
MSERINLIPRRVTIVMLAGTVIFALLILRLFWVQLVWGGELRREAEQVQTREITLQPERGNIYDRNHNLLVTSVPCYSVYANPELFKHPDAAADKIAPLLGLKRDEVYKKLSGKEPFAWLKYGVDFATEEKLRHLNISGLGFVETSKRAYKQGSLAANVLGFAGNDNQGLYGLEKSYDRELSGAPGRLVMQVDADGRQIPQTDALIYPSRPGDQLTLTIDQTIQFFVERELDRIVATYKPARAVILVMDPQTGEVLAMGSRPTFDPSHWQDYPSRVWGQNPATYYTYEPGSTFKIIVTAAGLEEGVVHPGDWFDDPGYAVVQGRRIYDAERNNLGSVSFARGVEDSLNAVFAQVGLRLGRDRLYKYIQGFGFGSPTNIDLPGEEPGIVIPEKNASPLNVATMSIGQSIAVTPVQLLTAICAVANGGQLLQPHLVKEIANGTGKVIKDVRPQLVRRVISAETASQETGLLEKVVTKGTGQKALVPGYTVAGKTGTAQVPGPGGYQAGKYVSSFAGFAPAVNPRVAVLVMVAEPQGQYYGGDVAAPAFSAVVRDTLRYFGVPEEAGQEQPDGASGGTVAAGGNNVAVPNLIGLPVDDARWLLGERGLNCWTPGNKGVVSGQQPAAGRNVNPGAVVSLQVTSASGQITIPDLTGLTMKKAGAVLGDLGLNIKLSGSGVAVKQEPSPGAHVSRGSTVTVEFQPPPGG